MTNQSAVPSMTEDEEAKRGKCDERKRRGRNNGLSCISPSHPFAFEAEEVPGD